MVTMRSSAGGNCDSTLSVVVNQILDGVRVGGELAEGEHGAVDGDRWQHRVDPASVRQPGIDHRAALVEPAAHPGHHFVDDATQMVLVDEGRLHRHDPTESLDVDAVGRVHHDPC